MVTLLYRKQRARTVFADSKMAIRSERQGSGKSSPKVEDPGLQALMDEDDTQSQTTLADQLGVKQAAISMRLHATVKVQNVEI